MESLGRLLILILIVVAIASVAYLLNRKKKIKSSNSNWYFDHLREQEHIKAGHKRRVSAIDMKMGKFRGHWEDKDGNNLHEY